MESSVAAIGDVQSVLLAMQKNLECPICLELIKEPVSTKCDHIFCRFCMFKLLSKKKKGPAQCPLCKTEITKRSLQENPRFKQLIEGLLETIHAFELDTGIKFLNSQDFSKKPVETSSTELLWREGSIIQSKGYRNRQKRIQEQENPTLEANADAQVADNMVRRSSLRNKRQKCESGKAVYIEFGSDSSDDLFEKAGGGGMGDKELFQTPPQKGECEEELKYAEKESESPYNMWPLKSDAGEILSSDILGECGVSEEDSKGIWNSIEDLEAAQVNVAEGHLKESQGISVSNSQAEQCDRTANASSLLNEDTSLFYSAEEMDAGETPFSSKNKESGLAHSSEKQLDKSKKTGNGVQHTEAVETCQPESSSLHEREPALESLWQPKTLHSNPLSQVSGKRLKRSIQKVNEWFSKSNEMLSSSSSQDAPAGATDTEDGDSYLSDRESCISEKTDLIVNCTEVVMGCENDRSLSKSIVHNIEDKIFGKTYKREKKSNPLVHTREMPWSPKMEDVTTDVKPSSNSGASKLKRKRKTASDLQPVDFIKKRDEKDLKKHSEGVNQCLVGRNAGRKESGEGSTVVNGSPMGVKNGDSIPAELPLQEGKSILKNDTEKVTCNSTDGEPAQNTCDRKSSKKMRSSQTTRSRHSGRPVCSLQLVVDRNSSCPDLTEMQIDSYPSSEEPRKGDSEKKRVRRSRRLQLLTEKMTKETRRRGEPNERARKHASESKDSSPGLQRNVLVHVPECKDPDEQQDVLNHSIPLSDTDLKGNDLQADKTHRNPENCSDGMQTGKGLFYVKISVEDLNACSVVPDTDSQVCENQGSQSLLQPHSTNVDQAACPVQNLSENNQCAATEPKKKELCAGSPKTNRHCTENDLERFRNPKSPEAKLISELNTETEDSEIDTQYLRNMFRHSKRLSFTLHPSPVKESVTESTASETLRKSGASCVEYRHNNRDLKNEPTYVKKTVGLDEVCEREEPKTSDSAKGISGHKPGTHFSRDTEYGHVGDDGKTISQVPDQVQLFSPPRAATAKIKSRGRLQKRRQPKEKRISPEIVIESQLSQNLNKSNGSLGDRSNIEEQIFQITDLSTMNETESNQGVKAEEAENKGPVLNLQPKPVLVYPVVCQQSPAEFSCKVIEKNGYEGECKQVKSDKEQVFQIASVGVLECLISEEALEQPTEDTSDFPLLSETPDGLLCSAGDIKENISICEIDRKEISAVFVKKNQEPSLRELNSGSSSSKSKSQNFVREPRRPAWKLQSSEEESSEDEELPCFQALIFGKSAGTPLQPTEQIMSTVESSSPAEILALLNSSSGNNKAVQKTPRVSLRDMCVSPSQESECSVNLFSSQSNMSEDSTNRPQELKTPITLAPCSKEMSSSNVSREANPNGNEELTGRKTDLEGGHQLDQNVQPHLGEASGYDSEASHPGDSSGLSSQCEILTTQQKDAMQNNLKKLQQEMAVLEAVLEEHGSQGFEFQPRASELPHSRVEGTLTVGQMRPARGTALISEVDLENHKISSSKGLSADGFHVMPSDHSNTKNKELEKEGSPALHLSHPKSHLFKKEALEQGHWCPSLWKAKTHSKEGTVQQVDVAVLLEQEGVKQCNQYRIEPENAAEQEFGTRINSAAVLCGNERRTPNSSPLKFSERLTHFQTAESTNSVAVSWNVVNGKSTQGCKQERRAFSSASALHAGIVKENAKSPVTCRRQMSVVASGLNQSELLLVQKFARKTQSTLSNQITEGTTHVIMKTDMELVCERTLKYFLGIAGRKWVVSYEWIVQSFKEGRILDEYNFEVRGDVINGRNHEGPKRARRSQARKLFKDFEICCYGPFTDMRTGDLEWMVELCGASVVKQPHLFTHKANSIAVIVVQPDAWLENAGYRAIQQKCTAMVTREWVLDSVACYECQEFDTYLVSQS
ncbi:breast cancer type 1 susceptibility protein isoform X2 [Gopherus evgoodei]|uniref:breast cancer type 1 susceptibility protein isoform X2 n=1 Tax=Gopherus evgoodei TaxID=1825980 RepID=UPI0011CF0177|nr:breast cancer type 1 susceptibility protein isoform X2 [Gopherus evgoodei]